jgi:hypothetical protein
MARLPDAAFAAVIIALAWAIIGGALLAIVAVARLMAVAS